MPRLGYASLREESLWLVEAYASALNRFSKTKSGEEEEEDDDENRCVWGNQLDGRRGERAVRALSYAVSCCLGAMHGQSSWRRGC
jgi:hypothetical protein